MFNGETQIKGFPTVQTSLIVKRPCSRETGTPQMREPSSYSRKRQVVARIPRAQRYDGPEESGC